MDALLPLLLIVVVLGGIRYGLFTATEAAAVAVVYALLLAAFVYRTLTFRLLWNKLVETAILTGMVLLIVGAARLLSWVLATQQVPQTFAAVRHAARRRKHAVSADDHRGVSPARHHPRGRAGHRDADADPRPDRAAARHQPRALRCHHRRDPGHLGLHATGRHQPARRVLSRPREPSEVARPLCPYLAILLLVTLLIAFVPALSLFLPRMVGYGR